VEKVNGRTANERQHQEKCRKDPADAAQIERRQSKTTLIEFPEDYARNQIARYYEEYVNADKSSGSEV
jgi:hypothetical protein